MHAIPSQRALRFVFVANVISMQGSGMREGLHVLRDQPPLVLLGISWALFLGAMFTGVVVTPSLSERIFHGGAMGYGWLNAGWGTGAFLSALYGPGVIAWLGGRRAVAVSMALLAACIISLQFHAD